MHGDGHRRNCPSCGRSVSHITDTLSHRELRGPRQITSSNIDRIFDDDGKRLLLIEEKNPGEKVSVGQRKLLRALAAIPEITVWGTRGTPTELRVTDIGTGDLVTEGNWGNYQQAVTDWFASPRPQPRDDWFAALTAAPYTPPAWCPPELWHQFDRILTEIARNRHAA